MNDPADVLQRQGPNSRAARRIQIAAVDEVDRLADIIKDYVNEAIEVEVAGVTIDAAPDQRTKTRQARIERCVGKILAGKVLRDR